MRAALWGAGGAFVVVMGLACGGDLGSVGNLGGLGTGSPLYGSGSVSGPIAGGMIEVDVSAGGGSDVSEVIGVPDSCVGYISPSQPDYQLDVSGSMSALSIGSCSNDDTALLIRDPMGDIHCIDDSEGTNPVWVSKAPTTGTYDVWVATYSGGSISSAKLRITDSEDPVCSRIQASGPTLAPEITLARGFGSHEISTQAGGPVDAPSMPNSRGFCTGQIREEGPTARLQLGAGSGSLDIASCSGDDTTLVVRAPDGSWLCDDDSEGSNPVVTVASAQAGTYDIFVGSYAGGTAPTQLKMSEMTGASLCTSGK